MHIYIIRLGLVYYIVAAIYDGRVRPLHVYMLCTYLYIYIIYLDIYPYLDVCINIHIYIIRLGLVY